jgi:hypothetical protein
MKEIKQEPNLPAPTNCFGKEQPIATWYECPHCGRPSPLTRQWVGMTDEDYYDDRASRARCFVAGVKWAEAKLREKNT